MDGSQQDAVNKSDVMQTFGAEEVIFREGEKCDAMYKILSGSVVIYMRYGEKDEHLVGIYSKSRCFGELNVFSEQPCIYTAVAFDDVLLMKITKSSLEKFVVNYPKNAIDIMKSMAQSFNVLQNNVNLLLDEVYEKDTVGKERTQELKYKMMQYTFRGQSLDRYV